ncbi:MAG: Fur family transcriptional regulator [Oscillospiraceae bacterium]
MPQRKINDSIACLKAAGLKITKQRTEILSVILASNSQLTAHDIFIKLAEQKRRYSFATIYRTVNVFEQMGIIKQVMITDDPVAYYIFSGTTIQDKFEMGEDHFHHLVCVKCKKFIPLEACPVDQFSHEMAEKNGFRITGHSFEIFGVCPQCQLNKA